MSSLVVGLAVKRDEASAVEDLKEVFRGVAERYEPLEKADRHDLVNFSKAFRSIVEGLAQLQTASIDDQNAILFLDSAALSKSVEKACSTEQRILKADIEERYILGIVLEPLKEMGSKDSQNDTYSAEEVRKSAYRFMEEFAVIGLQHREFVNGLVKIRENWVTREDTTINGQFVNKGTWLLGVHVVDDDLWEAVKAGKYTGYSIGGFATRDKISE